MGRGRRTAAAEAANPVEPTAKIANAEMISGRTIPIPKFIRRFFLRRDNMLQPQKALDMLSAR
jgi:hypothetical protein